jgi:hypothetical protein
MTMQSRSTSTGTIIRSVESWGRDLLLDQAHDAFAAASQFMGAAPYEVAEGREQEHDHLFAMQIERHFEGWTL